MFAYKAKYKQKLLIKIVGRKNGVTSAEKKVAIITGIKND